MKILIFLVKFHFIILKKHKQKCYLNFFSKHLYLDENKSKIYILVCWNDDNCKVNEKWVNIKNIIFNNLELRNISFKCPPYWCLYIFNYWNNILVKIKENINLQDRNMNLQIE